MYKENHKRKEHMTKAQGLIETVKGCVALVRSHKKGVRIVKATGTERAIFRGLGARQEAKEQYRQAA